MTMPTDVNTEQLALMLHTLGYDYARGRKSFSPTRNGFSSSEGSEEYVQLDDLVKKGYMTVVHSEMFGILFHCTEKGMQVCQCMYRMVT